MERFCNSSVPVSVCVFGGRYLPHYGAVLQWLRSSQCVRVWWEIFTTIWSGSAMAPFQSVCACLVGDIYDNMERFCNNSVPVSVCVFGGRYLPHYGAVPFQTVCACLLGDIYDMMEQFCNGSVPVSVCVFGGRYLRQYGAILQWLRSSQCVRVWWEIFTTLWSGSAMAPFQSVCAFLVGNLRQDGAESYQYMIKLWI
jgi:hypothetical protein